MPVVSSLVSRPVSAPCERGWEPWGITVRLAASLVVFGLSPGDSYNIRLEHRVSAVGNATIDCRHVIVTAT